MANKTFYLTTTLPYVNADPHIGFALEIVHADIIARYKRMMGYDVFFNTGTDEHGQKIFQKSLELKQDPQAYVDEYAAKFKGLKEKLGLYEKLHFIRTTDSHHKKAAQEFWKICDKNGFIEKKNYKIKYCVGCELEKTESELVDGKCPLHPNLEIQIIDEENYFFAFSKFQKKLLALYEARPDFVIPHSRLNEIQVFVERGLEDFSISRLKSKMSWGVPVPGDEDHVMYVWFDALVNYISAIGWPEDTSLFEKYWPVTQYAGKDNLRQQAAMWQAMLMSVGLTPSEQIVIHGFITSGGQKMSKSLGNVINPYDIVAEYGTEALRYYLAREIHPFEDSDFTMEKFKNSYNANLANGLGNLVSRVLKMAETHLESAVAVTDADFPESYTKPLENFEINRAADFVWSEISRLDGYIQETQPFKLVKTDKEKAVAIIQELVQGVYTIGRLLAPFLPTTSQKIIEAVRQNKMPEPLFIRK